MNKQINTIKNTRIYLLRSMDDLSVDQLNEIPPGFNNNIVWNLGHLVATQQSICYARAGANPIVDEKFLAAYKPGTKPEHYADDNQISMIKSLLLSTIDQFREDYENNTLTAYNGVATRYGVELKNLQDAVYFLTYHEGLHCGYITALKRLVKK